MDTILWMVVGGIVAMVIMAAVRMAWRALVGWYDRVWFDSEGDGRYE